eukprot:5987074-Pyramimonas_sp.AAC.1
MERHQHQQPAAGTERDGGGFGRVEVAERQKLKCALALHCALDLPRPETLNIMRVEGRELMITRVEDARRMGARAGRDTQSGRAARNDRALDARQPQLTRHRPMSRVSRHEESRATSGDIGERREALARVGRVVDQPLEAPSVSADHLEGDGESLAHVFS